VYVTESTELKITLPIAAATADDNNKYNRPSGNNNNDADDNYNNYDNDRNNTICRTPYADDHVEISEGRHISVAFL